MRDILFSLVLFIFSLFIIFISKMIMYKVFKCKNYKKNLYFSSGILVLLSFITFLLMTWILSKGNVFELSINLSSFSLVYLASLAISLLINGVFEHNIYKNEKYVYVKEKKNKKKS